MSFTFSQDFIARFNRREPSAITWIYNEYYAFVYSIVKKITSNSPDTKDLVADSFVKLIRYGAPFESLPKIKFFLYTAAKNACLDYLKRLKIQQKKEFDIQRQWIPDLTYAEENTERIAEFRRLLFQAIENLPRQCRQIFLLYYINALKNSEIASRLGISEKTVSNQKNLAKKILKIRLSKVKNVSISFFLIGSWHSLHLHYFLKLIYGG
jgi:RNA polymerase sigma-70 factor (ECF subfamily)